MARELVALAHRAPEGRRGWLIEEINGQPAADDPASRFLIDAGFAATHNGLQFRIGKATQAARPEAASRSLRRCLKATSIFRAARSLHKALAGHVVTKFDTAYAHLSRVDDDTPIAGRTIERCESAGKHLLIVFSGDLILRTHMRMNGSWHLYRHGERWWRGPQAMRVRIDTADWVAVAFDVPVAEFVTRAPARSDRPGGRARTRPARCRRSIAMRRSAALSSSGAMPIAQALLDQRLVAGIGNIYKSEVLFLAGIHPDTPASAVPVAVLERLLDIARSLLQDECDRRDTGGDPDLSLAEANLARRGSRRQPVGLRPQGQAVPQVRHADRVEEDGRRGADDLLVSTVSDTLPKSATRL